MYLVKRWIAAAATCLLMAAGIPIVCAEEAVQVSSSASSAVLYEPSTGRVLFEQQAHVKRPMASTTKLMTALLAVEHLPPDAVLTAEAQALHVEGTSLGLCAGDTVSRDDLLYGLLLSSGNDAANVLALSISQSYEEFAELMNTRAQAIGMTDSCFVTPSGLDAQGHGASAYDMALLAAEVLKHDVLATICATTEAQITLGSRKVALSNHNRLLRTYDGAIGMKTGYTSQAGRCLVSAANRDGVTLIAVTLDCGNDWEEHAALLDAGFACLTSVTLTPPALPKLTVLGGQRVPLSVESPATQVTVLNDDRDAIMTEVVMPPYRWAPIKAGDTVGEVRYMLRGTAVATAPITVCEDVPSAMPFSWFAKVKERFGRLLFRALT